MLLIQNGNALKESTQHVARWISKEMGIHHSQELATSLAVCEKCGASLWIKVFLVAWKWSLNVCGAIPYRVASCKIKEANGSLFHLQ